MNQPVIFFQKDKTELASPSRWKTHGVNRDIRKTAREMSRGEPAESGRPPPAATHSPGVLSSLRSLALRDITSLLSARIDTFIVKRRANRIKIWR
jgi:hypothetical protein